MDPLIGSALVGGAASLASSGLGFFTSEKKTKRLADYQNAINVKNWQMQNEYNTPAAQMQRLQEAGLNPHLMYGQGSTGQADSINSVQMPDSQGLEIDPLRFMQGYQSFRLSQEQQNNLQAVSAKTLADLQKTQAETKILEETGLQKARFDIQRQIAEISAIDANKRSTEQDIQLKRLTRQEKQLNLDYLTKTLQDRIELVMFDKEKTKAEISRIRQEIDNLSEQYLGYQLDNREKAYLLNELEQYGLYRKGNIFANGLGLAANDRFQSFGESLMNQPSNLRVLVNGVQRLFRQNAIRKSVKKSGARL